MGSVTFIDLIATVLCQFNIFYLNNFLETNYEINQIIRSKSLLCFTWFNASSLSWAVFVNYV